MVYMDEWEYHVYLELQSKKALLSSEETGYKEVMPKGRDREPSAVTADDALEG